MEPLGIALIGCGTVGSGVARLLLEHPERLASRAGRRLILRRIVVRDLQRPRPDWIPGHILTTNLREVLEDGDVQAAVEVVGGVDWARRAVLDLFAAGKDVVTANKALLALHGREIFDAGRLHGKALAFEASVGGGIPIIGALSHGLAANRILSVQGILNGTCNYILTGMSERGISYEQALAEAQEQGYAEADPTLDVDGTDAAHKLAILVQIAFGINIPFDRIARRGIADIHQDDIRYARELGYTIKLLAEAWLQPGGDQDPDEGGQLAVHVSPVMLRHLAPLALVRDAFNAVFVEGDAVGSTLFYGRGAGQMPTASAVVADLIDLAAGRTQRTFEALRLWSGDAAAIDLRPPGTVPSRYYVRLMVQDRPGVLAEVARILADHDISISSVIQHEGVDGPNGNIVPLIILTHTATTGSFEATLDRLASLPTLTATPTFFPVAD